MVITNCKPEELVQVINLLKKTDLFWEIGDQEDVLRKKLQYDPESIMVLRHDGVIIGTVTFTYDPWASFMWHLAIDPVFQGQGLGHLLAEEAERRLQARGTTSVNGYVRPENTHSFALLKKRGYAIWETLVVPVEKIV